MRAINIFLISNSTSNGEIAVGGGKKRTAQNGCGWLRWWYSTDGETNLGRGGPSGRHRITAPPAGSVLKKDDDGTK